MISRAHLWICGCLRPAQVIPAVRANLKPNGLAILLIKPQFEAKRGEARCHAANPTQACTRGTPDSHENQLS